MSLETANLVYPLAARDLMVAIAGREQFESTLDAFARRRAGVYSKPSAATSGELYWVVLAAALAPVGPPEWMPMSGLIEHGLTLEGGARGLRGLFVREPSEKERRKVQRTASLAARVMEIVAGSDANIRPDERRAVAMAMASFGLTPDELSLLRSTTPATPEGLEIFGDLDTRTRRELVRGAWQLAMLDKIEPAEELAVRAVAARLEMSAECDQLRADVVEHTSRQGEMAAVAVELARGPLRAVPFERVRPWLEHLVTAAAPWTRQLDLLQTATSSAAVRLDAMPRLDAPRRCQAVALALVTILGHDPSVSASLHLRAELSAAAAVAGAAGETGEAFGAVERFLFDRVRELSITPEAVARPPAPPRT